jgi:hypothetical protein
LTQNFFDFIGGDPAVHIFVDFQYRPEAAASDAAHRFQGVTPVSGGLTVGDVQRLVQPLADALAPRTWQAVPRQMEMMFLPRGSRLKVL